MLTKQKIKNKHYLVRARRLNKQGILYPSVIKLAEELNVSEVLIYLDKEQKAIKIAKKVLNWIDKHDGKYPRCGSYNSIEKHYGVWISNQKTAKQDKGTRKYYKSVYDVFESKYPHIFDTLEEKEIETANKVLNWIGDHGGNYPNKHSKDTIEKQYGVWVQKITKRKGTWKYYESVYKIFEKKYPKIFDVKDLEQEAVEKAGNIFNWMEINGGKYPKYETKNKLEQQYARWIQYQKYAKQGKKGYIYYESVYDVFRSKYPHIFDTLEEQNIEIANQVFNWIEDHGGKYPSHYSNDKVEKQYANWIRKRKLNNEYKEKNVGDWIIFQKDKLNNYNIIYKIFEKNILIYLIIAR